MTLFRKTALANAISLLLLPAGVAVHAAEDSASTQLKAVTIAADSLGSTTENTGAYTTGSMYTNTKMNMSAKETPQSVSVITRTFMDDYDMDNINDVLKSATGITVEQVETDRTYYTARGFEINNFQMDGIGQPLNWNIMNGDLDTAIYDSVEVVRGASGLMSGAGNPSATINRIRKRPTADLHIEAEFSAGTWDDQRIDTDISSAISENVRGRFITVHQEKESYIDDYAHEKYVVYGVMEADLSETTLLTFGISQQKNDADSPMWGALPLYYSNGQQTDYDVASNTSADWSYWDSVNNETFVELLQQFNTQWSLRAIYTHTSKEEDGELFYTYGATDPVTHEGLTGYASKYLVDAKSDLLDVYVNGKFSAWNLEHDLVMGVSTAKTVIDEVSLYDYTTPFGFPAIGNFLVWNGNTPRPTLTDGKEGSDFQDKQSAIYAATRIRATENLSLISGARVVDWKSKGYSYGESETLHEKKVVPYAGLVLDITPQLAVYSSYTETFMPQNELDASFERLEPAEGTSSETGIKFATLDGRLNANAAIFTAEHSNIAEYLGLVGGKYVYDGHDYQSSGIELEIAGRITEGLEATAGYTYVDINEKGKSAKTYVPAHLLKVATSYRLPVVANIKIGAKANWQSNIEISQLNYATGTVKQDDYVLLDMFANYSITKQLKTSVNLENITNEKYIGSLMWDQGFYGAPRNINASVSWEY